MATRAARAGHARPAGRWSASGPLDRAVHGDARRASARAGPAARWCARAPGRGRSAGSPAAASAACRSFDAGGGRISLGLRLGERRDEPGAGTPRPGADDRHVVTAVHQALGEQVADQLGAAVPARRDFVVGRGDDHDAHGRSSIVSTCLLASGRCAPERAGRARGRAGDRGRASSPPRHRPARGVPADRTLAVFDGERIVGGVGSEPREVTVPGGAVGRPRRSPWPGCCPATVACGAASELVRRQLPDLRARAGSRWRS